MLKRLFVTINDVIALVLLVLVIPGLWLCIGLGRINWPGEITGATIMAWGLILQYYFRKKPEAPKT